MPGTPARGPVAKPIFGFRGMTRVARQREVHRLLAAELAGPVHALSIAARTPEEADDG
jgi:stress-induced morphogen